MSADRKSLVDDHVARLHDAVEQPVSHVRASTGAAPAAAASVASPTRSIWPVILWVTVPFWLLMTATRVSSYMVRVAAVPDVKIAEPLERTLQHAILFVVLIGSERLLLRCGMQQAESMLDPAMFLRIHRSVIINTRHIKEIARQLYGDYEVTLSNGTRFSSGRAYRRRVVNYLNSGRL